MQQFSAPFLMAPMAGVTDASFRARLVRNGCKALWTEMISAAAMVRKHRHTLAMATPEEFDLETVVQLFGAKPEELGPAAEMLWHMGWQRIDLNMGCPVKKVVKSGSGAALMRTPELARACISAVRENFRGIFTVKIRLGWSSEEENFLEVGELAAGEGVDALTLHGRTRAQLYGGEADWGKIERLADALKIPLAGNGDIRTASQAVNRLDSHGVAAVMIGRMALEAPWLFRDAHLLKDGKKPLGRPPAPELAEDLRLQFLDIKARKGERPAVAEMKKFAAWALKGFTGAATLRSEVMKVTDADGMERMIYTIGGLCEAFAVAGEG